MRSATQKIVDELLVMHCQDGRPGAMDKLVRRWHRPLWRHARRLTGKPDAAWEVVQEAWVGICRGLGRLDDAARFRPWAYRIVTNKAADWIRKRQRGRADQFDEQTAPPPALARDDGAVDRVRAGLARLGVEHRTVMSLRYLDGFTVAEIAHVLDVPAGTVKSRLHNARNELKRILEPDRPRDH